MTDLAYGRQYDPTNREHARFRFAQFPDDKIFSENIGMRTIEEADAYKVEKAKRLKAREEEAAKREAERATKLMAYKSTITYSNSLAQEICERISTGELLICICEDEHMPTMRNSYRWLKEHDDFQAVYSDSINDRLNVFEEEVIKIADDMLKDFKTIVKNGKEKRVADPEMIMRAKLRVEVRFRHLKAGRPQKWGDSTTLNVKSDDKLDPANLTLDELERKIADIEHKSRPVRKVA